MASECNYEQLADKILISGIFCSTQASAPSVRLKIFLWGNFGLFKSFGASRGLPVAKKHKKRAITF